MLDQYCKKIGLPSFPIYENDRKMHSLVETATRMNPPAFSEEEVRILYEYRVPKISADGTCSMNDTWEEKPYTLAQIYGTSDETTARLWRLKKVVHALQKIISADWLGIYRKIKKQNGEDVLVKEAYDGTPSRAEFPLTLEFAAHSNNATVGLTGKAVSFHNIATYAGPYYQCDGRVQSEFCCPIVDRHGKVRGIIDAESFQKDFFTPSKILRIAEVCMDLGRSKLFSSLF